MAIRLQTEMETDELIKSNFIKISNASWNGKSCQEAMMYNKIATYTEASKGLYNRLEKRNNVQYRKRIGRMENETANKVLKRAITKI